MAPRIARKIERHSGASPATLVSLVSALEALRDPSTEPALVKLLSHRSNDVRRAAADALGEFGSVGAVEPLLGLTGELFLARETKAALLEAVARIQSRLGQVDAGAISLADQPD